MCMKATQALFFVASESSLWRCWGIHLADFMRWSDCIFAMLAVRSHVKYPWAVVLRSLTEEGDGYKPCLKLNHCRAKVGYTENCICMSTYLFALVEVQSRWCPIYQTVLQVISFFLFQSVDSRYSDDYNHDCSYSSQPCIEVTLFTVYLLVQKSGGVGLNVAEFIGRSNCAFARARSSSYIKSARGE
jgi:hypothetical protein